jgi:hypothetical protein
MKFFKITLIILAIFSAAIAAKAQENTTKSNTSSADSLMNAMDKDQKPEDVIGGFKATRLINSQTTQTVRQSNLNFLIIHRFGDFAGNNGGGKFAYGLDDINDVYIGFEYGLTDNLQVDLGRSTIGRLVQGELKYAFLHQTTDNSMPLSATVLGEYGIRTYGTYDTFGDRTSLLGQLVISRSFNFLSFLVSPTIVSNGQPTPDVPGNGDSFFALQAATRIKLTKHSGFIIDYAHSFSQYRNNAESNMRDPLGFGWEVETGGHVFTVNVTNANAISEINYLNNTTQSWGKGQYRIGFTISRMFDLSKHKTDDKKWNDK